MTRIRIHIPVKAIIEAMPLSPKPIPGIDTPIFIGTRSISPALYQSLDPSIRASIRVEATKAAGGAAQKSKVTPISLDPGIRATMRVEALKPGSSGHKITDKPIVSVTPPEVRAEVPEEQVKPVVMSKTYREAQEKAVVSVEVRKMIR